MRRLELVTEGARLMTICNSCRYCEQYCAVFPAMAARRTFTAADIDYLANLCHNCGECLYACQYAPPHAFGVDVPRTLAQVRASSYEAYCWPGLLAGAFSRHQIATALLLATVLSAVLGAATWLWNPEGLAGVARGGDFYAVIPHSAMVGLFGVVSLFVLLAVVLSLRRFWRSVNEGTPVPLAAVMRGGKDALTLRNLHGSGRNCTVAEETRVPWRRWFHHLTFYGFLLCFASTTVAAIYHSVFGWAAPYPPLSAPVVLGTLGGVGLVVGPLGLLWQRRRRDRALTDEAQQGLDESFIVLLACTGISGFLLLGLRATALMPALLIVHLGIVLALLLTLPYGKFMHGLYRTAALIKSASEPEGGHH